MWIRACVKAAHTTRSASIANCVVKVGEDGGDGGGDGRLLTADRRLGYYGNASSGSPYACQTCPCPHPVDSNNFAVSCNVDERGQLTQCNCKRGYTGARFYIQLKISSSMPRLQL